MTAILLIIAILGAPWMFVIFWFVLGGLVASDEDKR